MPRPHRCPHTRPRPPAAPLPRALHSTDAALAVVHAALGPAPGCVVVLPLDARHEGGRAICVDDVPRDDAVLEVVDLVLAAHAATDSALRALVVGSRRAAPVAWPTTDDWWCYAAMAERCEAAGVTLLDWVLAGTQGALSLAELDGRSESRWWPA